MPPRAEQVRLLHGMIASYTELGRRQIPVRGKTACLALLSGLDYLGPLRVFIGRDACALPRISLQDPWYVRQHCLLGPGQPLVVW